MKRLLWGLLTTLIVLLLVLCPDKKAIAYGDLTAGINILRNESVAVFGNIKGSSIRITSDMIRTISGRDTEFVQFRALPNRSSGRLELCGKTVEVNERIDLLEDTVILFIPHHFDEIQDKLIFTKNGMSQSYECSLVLSDLEAERLRIQSDSLTTFKNVAISGKIRPLQGEAKNFIITKSTQNGYIELEQDSGKFKYVPKRNFTGKDRFSCIAVDAHGNQSQEISIVIQTEKAPQNLYFYDCIDNPVQKSAIILCSNKLMNYETDEQGLPIFLPKKAVTAEELTTFLGNLSINNTIEVMNHDSDSATLTKSSAYRIALHALSEQIESNVMEEIKPLKENDEPFTREDCAFLMCALYEKTLNGVRN